jgi:hypothetical protein
VGVFLKLNLDDPDAASFPHARGGVSFVITNKRGIFRFSPRMWGCFFKEVFQMSRQFCFKVPIDKSRAVEKDVAGKKSRYLAGVASGLKEDAHGERVSERCIASMCRQAESGDILLYADTHGVKESEDIGILENFKVLEDGDWYVEFRLYGEGDPVDDASIQKATKLWGQVNGLPPYHRPRRKGFSIEGEVPEDAILIQKKETLGIIDDIILKGVVVVPEPAYENSVINAVYKALDAEPPARIRMAIHKRLVGVIRKDKQARYDFDRYSIDEERDKMIAEVVKEKSGEGLTKSLRDIFNEYTDLSVKMIAENPALVGDNNEVSPVMASPYTEAEFVEDVDPQRMAMLTVIERQLETLLSRRQDYGDQSSQVANPGREAEAG